MPYIDAETRAHYERFFFQMEEQFAAALPGELAYILYRIVLAYWNTHQAYTGAANILGVLQTVSNEFYRREVAPYEDKKMLDNGDIRTAREEDDEERHR